MGREDFRLLAKNFKRKLQVEIIPDLKGHSATGGRPNVSMAAASNHGGVSSVSNGGADHEDDESDNAEKEETPGGESGGEEIVVPNPDFGNFDEKRTASCMKKHQLWAVYDDTDGMPRFYCQIKKVTRYPFVVETVWLEPIHPEKDNLTWLNNRNLSLGAGGFKLGLGEVFRSENVFSHQMKKLKMDNRYAVYPKIGEIWAVYADYDKETSIDAEGKMKLRYDYVVINDFSAMSVIGKVTRLQKLKRFKTLWAPVGEAFAVKTYDLHKFSHKVPSVGVKEKDAQGLPWGCLELDPASSPADVIQD